MKRLGLGETVIVSIVIFLGTGVYNMYKLHRQADALAFEHKRVQEVQDKYCNIQNPTYEQQAVCIEILKTNNEDRK